MRIKQISTAVLESNFDWTLVKVETANGIIGYGESFLGPGLPAVIQEFASVLIGEDAASIDRLLRRLRAMTVYASPGLVWHALAGIETALLDALGKTYRMPVWQMLGGKYRDTVSIYADCHAGDALESMTPLLLPRTPGWMKSDVVTGHIRAMEVGEGNGHRVLLYRETGAPRDSPRDGRILRRPALQHHALVAASGGAGGPVSASAY